MFVERSADWMVDEVVVVVFTFIKLFTQNMWIGHFVINANILIVGHIFFLRKYKRILPWFLNNYVGNAYQ